MILAHELKNRPIHTATTLSKLTKRQFDTVLFLGITNGGQHCYRCSKNTGDTIVYTKVFTTPGGTTTIET